MRAPTSGKQYGSGSSESKRSSSSRSSSPSRRKDEKDILGKGRTPSSSSTSSRLVRKLGKEDSSSSLGTNGSSAGNSRTSGSGRKDSSPQSKKVSAENGTNGKQVVSRKHIIVNGIMSTLADALPSERQGLLLQKLEICTVVYDFRLDTMGREKEVKRQTLVALIEHMSTASKDCWTEAIVTATVDMVSANIFRILEIRERTPLDMMDMDDEEPFLEPAWSHLQLVYEFLRLFVSNKDVDTKMAAKFFNARFVTKLLALLDSDDTREREAVKLAMLKYYSRFTTMRTISRKALQAACTRVCFDDIAPNGIAELLELMSKVINGFASPLKMEQVELLTKVLIPLHKVDMFFLFSRQLIHCMTQFIEKDSSLCHDIVEALLYLWPYSCGSKQVLFIEELEQLMALLKADDFLRLREEVRNRICLVITCPNSLVAERGLQLWNNSSFVKTINAHREFMFPDIISALYRNATEHWYGQVHGRTFDVLKIMMEADETLFAESSMTHRRNSEDRERIDDNRLRKWRVLTDLNEKKERLAALAKPKPKPTAGGKAKGRAKAAPKNQPKHRDYSELLTNDNYGVSISANNAAAIACVDLQAIVIDKRGDVVCVVSQDNFTAMKAAAVHTPCTELREQLTNDGESDDGRGRKVFKPGAAVWLTLPRMPAHVKHIVFLLVTMDGQAARREPLRDCSVRVIDGASGEDAVSFTVNADPSGVVLLGSIERPTNDGSWSFGRLVDPRTKGHTEPLGKSCAHYVDVLDSLGNLVREVIPSPKTQQRVSLVLESGSVADLVQGLAPKGIFMGAGWDFSNRGYSDERLSVDVAAVFFGSGGKELGGVCAENPSEFGVRHSGSGMLSAGVAFSFEGISKEVHQIFLVAHVSTPHMTCEMLQNPSCRIIDQNNGVGILHFSIPECLHKSGLILGRMSLEPGRRKWCFQAIGHFCGGHAWKDEETLSVLRATSQKSLSDFQRQLDNATPVVQTPSDRLVTSI